jgi:hypothetical protein
MKKITSLLIVAIYISGCDPVNRLYDTPALYFGGMPSIPKTDSNNRIILGASVLTPFIIHTEGQFKVGKKYNVRMAYSGNASAYSKISNDNIGDYYFKTNMVDAGLGYKSKFNKSKGEWFISGDLGIGRSKSKVIEKYDYYDIVVPANDRHVHNEYYYTGVFTRIAFSEGIHFSMGKQGHLYLANRQSLVNFTNYILPDTSYKPKKQLLTDIALSYSFNYKSIALSVFTGAFLNGHTPGNRSLDNRPEVWRIERFYGGIGVHYSFLK